jgi:hypothetical protein
MQSTCTALAGAHAPEVDEKQACNVGNTASACRGWEQPNRQCGRNTLHAVLSMHPRTCRPSSALASAAVAAHVLDCTIHIQKRAYTLLLQSVPGAAPTSCAASVACVADRAKGLTSVHIMRPKERCSCCKPKANEHMT